MRKILTSMIVFAAVALAGGTAAAGGQSGTIGVGAEAMLAGDGIGGVSVNYDGGAFHAGGFLGFDDAEGQNNAVIEVGGRFYYHLHSTAMSDFGLGGGLGFQIQDTPGDSLTLLNIQLGLQVRTFIATNVALSGTAGLVIGTLDSTQGVAIDGDLTAGFGFHYYFF